MQMIEKNILLDNYTHMIKASPRFSIANSHHLLLSGLVLLTLSACSPAVQPWVAPENSQELKQLKIDNYLLKQELALYRKKLMQANLESRRMAEKLQQQGRQTSGMSSSGSSSQMQPASRATPSVQPVRRDPAPVSRPAPQPATRKAPVIAKAAPTEPQANKPQTSKSVQPETTAKSVNKPAAKPVKAAVDKAPANKVSNVAAKPSPPARKADATPQPAKKAVVAEKAASAPVTSPVNPAPVSQAKSVTAPQAAMPIASVAQTAAKPAQPQAVSNWRTVMTLYFDSGQRYTSPEMRKQLRKFANSLSPTAKIRVAGHTDSRTILQSSDAVEDNKAMSKERAWSVVRGLQAYGISPKRMQVGAFGATRPVAGNDTFEGRAKNRRVEILISE